MAFALKVENLSKAYKLGIIGTGSLSRDLEIWRAKMLGRPDPTLKIEDNSSQSAKNRQSTFWSLRGVNFTVTQGEAIGIIGANGAGKSTLLKILSRITSPTTGRVVGRGRVSSLLEVGTGFHHELTGRENIFLNGSIMGMRKAEIKKRFDEIVDFAGVSQYIDTPVKRYSSGMYVRLAFAVAAHLDPDILIIDEVLAVGDAEFQKKCLGKMNEVSTQQGRTILFVSHNLQAVANLCSSAIWLDKGLLKAQGPSKSVINQYLGAFQEKVWRHSFENQKEAPGNDKIKIISLELLPDLIEPLTTIDIRTSFQVKVSFNNLRGNVDLTMTLILFTLGGECIFEISSKPQIHREGILEGSCTIPGNLLNDGGYYFSIYFTKDTSILLFAYEECLSFDVEDFRENTNWYGKCWGYVRPAIPVLVKAH